MTEYKIRPRRRAADSENSGRNYGGDRPQRSFGDRPRRPYGERPQGDGEGRPSFGDRPRRSYGEGRPYGDRPQRNFGDRPRRPFGDRPHGEGDGRPSFGDRPRRSYGEGRPYGDRPQRSFGDRPRRPFGDRPQGDGEGRPSFSDRPRRNYGEGRPYGDRPQRSFGGGRRPFGDRRNGFGRKPYDQGFSDTDETGINQMISRRPQPNPADYSDNDFAPTPFKEEMRLNKFIANSGVCSRREADTFIEAGVVTVNGEVVTELGTKINVLTDDIRFNGERLKGEEKVYIVMNKPKGYVTTASDPHADKTVMDLLKGCEARVFAVGRLDKNTTGVLMFTNDGEMAERLTHPSYDKKKIYQVLLDKPLDQEDYNKILAGLTLNDGEIKADELEYIDETDHRKLGIEIHSGKNRIVRRIFESLGYDVRALDRVYFAGLTKKGLKKGDWRFLSEGEVNILRMGAYV